MALRQGRSSFDGFEAHKWTESVHSECATLPWPGEGPIGALSLRSRGAKASTTISWRQGNQYDLVAPRQEMATISWHQGKNYDLVAPWQATSSWRQGKQYDLVAPRQEHGYHLVAPRQELRSRGAKPSKYDLMAPRQAIRARGTKAIRSRGAKARHAVSRRRGKKCDLVAPRQEMRSRGAKARNAFSWHQGKEMRSRGAKARTAISWRQGKNTRLGGDAAGIAIRTRRSATHGSMRRESAGQAIQRADESSEPRVDLSVPRLV